jgi:23S rRNA (adenine2503-C2)-methyltransferase
LAGWGFSEFHANRLWDYLYRQRFVSIDQMEKLRPDLVSRLRMETSLSALNEKTAVNSLDGSTTKYLLSLTDAETVETVLMTYPGRSTACISTQVGCAMGCVFCATGQMGFIRSLKAGEIVAQVLHVIRQNEAAGDRLRNIVFMGMGEPLHNYDSTMKAIDILTDDRGLAIGPRYITISTVGLPAAIRRLADDGRPVNLAVSLHAATDEERNLIVPVGRRWNLDLLMQACHYYVTKREKRIFFEWALISGRNDTSEQANALGRLLEGLRAHVNLIPLNPTTGYDGIPSNDDAARRFQKTLSHYGLPSTIRQRRGVDINAGCGQLRTRVNNLTG